MRPQAQQKRRLRLETPFLFSDNFRLRAGLAGAERVAKLGVQAGIADQALTLSADADGETLSGWTEAQARRERNLVAADVVLDVLALHFADELERAVAREGHFDTGIQRGFVRL